MKFFKMSGAGNDFILVPASEIKTPRSKWSALAKRWCDRRNSIGADGLLIPEIPRRYRGILRLHYFNADGSRAFCGNGSRCAAQWAYATGRARGKSLVLVTEKGRLTARRVGRERIELKMPEVSKVRLGLRIRLNGSVRTLHYLNTGVPHVVMPVRNLKGIPVEAWGRRLRFHPRFKPAGANVNFVRFKKGSSLELRTYERGVEAETLACGTGVTASAVVACQLGRARPPVRCLTRGGDLLKVRFRMEGKALRDVRLEGPAKITFTGEIHV